MPEFKKQELVRIGALWKGSDRNGNLMLTGSLGNARLLVFKNTLKDNERQPDYNVYVCNKQKREDEEQPPADDERAKYGGNDPKALDDEIPF